MATSSYQGTEQPVTLPFTILAFEPGQDTDNYQHARVIRETVFVMEQGIEVEEDWDSVDPGQLHFLVLSEMTGQPIASARMGEVAQGCQTRPIAKIEWMAVLPPYRGQGIGKLLMDSILNHTRQSGYEAAYLQANATAVGFYKTFGFEAEGFAFEEGGHTYYAMRCMI